MGSITAGHGTVHADRGAPRRAACPAQKVKRRMLMFISKPMASMQTSMDEPP
jgi:hypothetical protein